MAPGDRSTAGVARNRSTGIWKRYTVRFVWRPRRYLLPTNWSSILKTGTPIQTWMNCVSRGRTERRRERPSQTWNPVKKDNFASGLPIPKRRMSSICLLPIPAALLPMSIWSLSADRYKTNCRRCQLLLPAWKKRKTAMSLPEKILVVRSVVYPGRYSRWRKGKKKYWTVDRGWWPCRWQVADATRIIMPIRLCSMTFARTGR